MSKGFSSRRLLTFSRYARAFGVKAPPVTNTSLRASCWMVLDQPFVELHPGDVRHHHVAEDDVESLILRENLLPLLTRLRLHDLMPAQDALQHTANSGLVVDHQHATRLA